MKLPLTIHILYHKDNKDGLKLYSDLYKVLCRDFKRPFDSGIGIPVYFYSDDDGGSISDVDFDISDKTLVLLLIDQNMYISPKWKEYIGKKLLPGLNSNSDRKLVSISQYKYAYELNAKLGKYQFLSFNNESVYQHRDEFLMRLYDILNRFIAGSGSQQQTIFISHSKRDDDKKGLRLATSLRDFLLENETKLSSFFDVNNIMEGYDFEKQILNSVDSSIMVVIFSNTYSSREWCVKEILQAKKNKIPMIVVFAVNGDIDRVFPYMGNVPATQYNDDWKPVVNLLLRTALFHQYQKKLLDKLKTDNMDLQVFPPDAYSLRYYKGEAKTVLYPEPPLGSCEMEILEDIKDKELKFTTPMLMNSEGIDLKKRNIAISVSLSEDISKKGIGKEMLYDAVVEIIRHIYISNGHIIYGGNLTENGFTYLFRDISYQYSQYHSLHTAAGDDVLEEHFLTSFVSWPYSEKITQDDKCDFLHCRVNLITMSSPVDKFCDGMSETDKHKIALTDMREQLEIYQQKDADGCEKPLLAHIFIGGRKSGFVGDKPGILEEFLLAKENHHPIFLFGGFGGETELIAKQLLEGDVMLPELNGVSVADLNDGIADESLRKILFQSTNIVEIIPILLTALNKLANE